MDVSLDRRENEIRPSKNVSAARGDVSPEFRDTSNLEVFSCGGGCNPDLQQLNKAKLGYFTQTLLFRGRTRTLQGCNAAGEGANAVQWMSHAAIKCAELNSF